METLAVPVRPHFIGPALPDTPDTGTTTTRTRALPHDLLMEASRRLGIVSLLMATLWIFGTVFYHFAVRATSPPGDPTWMRFQATDLFAAVAASISVALFAYARRKDRDPRFILDVGLVYLVFTSAGVGLVMHWQPGLKGHAISPEISWIGAVVLIFAAIVPNAPWKMVVAGLISACMNPVFMLVAQARGVWDFGPPINIVVTHYPDFLLVAVAALISRVVSKLGQQVTKAREMGSYRLMTLLGKGGMGEVWRARHRMLARDAAIKLIQPEMLGGHCGSNARVVRRFEQEARSTASLRSPHTVELYDFGVTETGVFYYVMELLDGIDLETLVRRFGTQCPDRVTLILRQVCRSLADAHGHGMIHRDIKPTNILLCRMGGEYDFAKVLDFGLVKLVDDKDPGLTAEGATTGTPAYMAPEIALGNPIDGRTDIYAVGCVAYWLLTGSLVFEEKSATASIMAHVGKPATPPSQKCRQFVPQWLDETILMCLEKDPAHRPESAVALARMLDRGTSDSWTPRDAENWWQTNMPENGSPTQIVPEGTVRGDDITMSA